MAWEDVAWGSCRWGADPPGVIKKVKIFDASPTSDNLNLTLNLSLPEDREMWVDWGDGKIDKVQGPVTNTDFAHTYSSEGTYEVSFYKDYDWLTRLSIQPSSCSVGGGIDSFRFLVRLEYLYVSNNTFNGSIKYFSHITNYIRIEGENTLYDDISVLSQNLEYLEIHGKNTVTGDIARLSKNLTVLALTGYNKVYGNLVSLGRDIVSLVLIGNNTVAGDVADAPDGIRYYLSVTGQNTISDYSGKTWATCPHRVKINPVSPGGLSTSEVDQLLIDLAANSDWVSGDYITLQGANAPRSSASDDAVAALVNMGVTVNTN